MANDGGFTLVNARHAVRADGVAVEFVSAHELRYEHKGASILLPAERNIGADGAPDGRAVRRDADARWTDGTLLTTADWEQLVIDLNAAAAALRTRFLFAR